MFPVYLNSNGFTPPDKGTYFLVSKNGTFMRVERAFGSAFVKVDDVPHLQEQTQALNYNLPRIPGRIIAQAKTFFEKVFNEYRSESYLTLYYSRKLEQFRLWCPAQKVSYASVNYERSDGIPIEETVADEGAQWQMIGTIHSHCDFSAFHSGTDTGDEESFDGIHITIGHVNSGDFSMVATVAVCGERKGMEINSVIEGVASAGETVVEEKGTVRGSYWRRKEDRYLLALNPEDQRWADEHLQPLVNEWFGKVTKTVYTSYAVDYRDDGFSRSRTYATQPSLFTADTVSSSEWQKSDLQVPSPPKGFIRGLFDGWSDRWKDLFS